MVSRPQPEYPSRAETTDQRRGDRPRRSRIRLARRSPRATEACSRRDPLIRAVILLCVSFNLVAAEDSVLKLLIEQRGRYEERTGTNFGTDPDIDTGLYRTRFGLTYTPQKWLRFSGML